MSHDVDGAFFSLGELDDPEPYIAWHQTDHMPEQFRIPGIRWAQRFAADDACMAAAAAAEGAIGRSRHLQTYLMADLPTTLPAFAALGKELAAAGRMRRDIVAHVSSPFDVVDRRVSPGATISPQALPFRPNTGCYLLAEVTAADTGRTRVPDSIVEVAGVVGAWTFRPSSTDWLVTPPVDLLTVAYLDSDPVDVAADLAAIVDERRSSGYRPVVARPFRPMTVPPAAWFTAPSGAR